MHLSSDPVPLLQDSQRPAAVLDFLAGLFEALAHSFEGGAKLPDLVPAVDADGAVEVAGGDTLRGSGEPLQGPGQGPPDEKSRRQSQAQGYAAGEEESPLQVVSGAEGFTLVLTDRH